MLSSGLATIRRLTGHLLQSLGRNELSVIRQDAYANAHRTVVEEEKPERERGFYLHPDLYGQPAEKSVEWANHPAQMRRMRAAAEKRPAAPPKQ